MDEDISIINKLTKSTQRNILYPVGIVGFVLVAGYGLYKFKNHKGRSSLYLIQLRLAAQGTAVGIVGVGVLYNIYNQSIKPKFKS